MHFTALRDELIDHTLSTHAVYGLSTQAWRGVTRGVEFARQCRNLHAFESMWATRNKYGLGLFDAWSVYTPANKQPHAGVESETINRIYTCLLWANGVDLKIEPATKAFALLAMTDVVIKKAMNHARPSPHF